LRDWSAAPDVISAPLDAFIAETEAEEEAESDGASRGDGVRRRLGSKVALAAN